jgi:hypothetical protein
MNMVTFPYCLEPVLQCLLLSKMNDRWPSMIGKEEIVSLRKRYGRMTDSYDTVGRFSEIVFFFCVQTAIVSIT